jgi:hypothetical protein
MARARCGASHGHGTNSPACGAPVPPGGAGAGSQDSGGSRVPSAFLTSRAVRWPEPISMMLGVATQRYPGLLNLLFARSMGPWESVPAPRGSGRGGRRGLARGGTDGVGLVRDCGRSGFGAGSYARLSATALVTTMKLCPRGHRSCQGLAPASLAECDTLTDFPDTPTDFRDTRRIFAAPCAIRCDHRSPLSLTDYRNFITGARAGIGRPPREIGDPFASRPPVPISRPCSTNPPGSFAPPTPRIRPDSCDVIGFVSQFFSGLSLLGL